jgi:hypothetical protein
MPMYLVAHTLHGVHCSQCMYRWLVKSILCVWWSVSRVVCLDEDGKGWQGPQPVSGGLLVSRCSKIQQGVVLKKVLVSVRNPRRHLRPSQSPNRFPSNTELL